MKRCARCLLKETCLPAGLQADELREFERLIDSRRCLKAKEVLYRTGDPFQRLYAIRAGCLEASVLAGDGGERIIGVHAEGAIVGFDGIFSGRHACNALALEKAEVCALPFDGLNALACRIPMLRQSMHRLWAREMRRSQDHTVLLGGKQTHQRLAAFLLDLAEQHRQRGRPSTELALRIARGPLGNYLGMTPEALSRGFHRLTAEGLIAVRGRKVTLLDPESLRGVVNRASVRRGRSRNPDSARTSAPRRPGSIPATGRTR